MYNNHTNTIWVCHTHLALFVTFSNLTLAGLGPTGSDLLITYASRTLSPAESNYSTTETGLLAIVWATNTLDHTFDRQFIIVTDHKPLEWLFKLEEPKSGLDRWRLKLEEHDYKTVYKKGFYKTNADALSRVEINVTDHENNQFIIANIGDAGQIINKSTIKPRSNTNPR